MYQERVHVNISVLCTSRDSLLESGCTCLYFRILYQWRVDAHICLYFRIIYQWRVDVHVYISGLYTSEERMYMSIFQDYILVESGCTLYMPIFQDYVLAESGCTCLYFRINVLVKSGCTCLYFRIMYQLRVDVHADQSMLLLALILIQKKLFLVLIKSFYNLLFVLFFYSISNLNPTHCFHDRKTL